MAAMSSLLSIAAPRNGSCPPLREAAGPGQTVLRVARVVVQRVSQRGCWHVPALLYMHPYAFELARLSRVKNLSRLIGLSCDCLAMGR